MCLSSQARNYRANWFIGSTLENMKRKEGETHRSVGQELAVSQIRRKKSRRGPPRRTPNLHPTDEMCVGTPEPGAPGAHYLARSVKIP